MDMISIFNQVTSKGLPNCDSFKSLVEDHFLKFRHFFHLIETIDTSNVLSIDYIKDGDDCVVFEIKAMDTSYAKTIKAKTIKEKSDNIFKVDTVVNGVTVTITISLKEPYKSEREVM